MNNTCKISIVIISYNQEDVIRRTIDSIIRQKNFVHEIVISDDASSDKTWNIINEYREKYSLLIRSFRNKSNQGIYGNLESTRSKVTGDLIFTIAGDDVFNDGLFERAIKLTKNNIISLSEDYLVYFDYQSIDVNGEIKKYSNRALKKHDSLYLKLRNKIANRTLGMSRSVWDKHYKLEREEGISVNEEGIFDLQPHLFAKQVYYEEFIGQTYYAGIGVSNNLDRSIYNLSKIKYCDTVIDLLAERQKVEHLLWMHLYKVKLVIKYDRSKLINTVYNFFKFWLSKNILNNNKSFN